MTGLLSTPMDATPRDGIVGYDEFGRPVYRSLLGHNYGEGLGATPHQPSAAQQRGLEMMRANQSGQMWQMDNREDWGTPGQAVGGLIGLLAEGALNGIATPGRAARGEPVTYGDVMDTALDWGILAAPGRAPAGALRSGGMASQSDDGIEAALRRAYPDLTIDISGNPSRGFTLNRVIVPETMRGQGVGSAFMRDLARMADEAGVQINLTPSADFGGNLARLREFYSRNGFLQNAGRNRDFSTMEDMYRPPMANE